ncbi:hypothetical protein DOE63_20690 [Salmonella enterica subsp. diarizonae serovar 59:z10:-]|nr:hypothetical protein DOE63_20690 [Salmonella enterica subsp. diarizonae serovar 59:z10:-]
MVAERGKETQKPENGLRNKIKQVAPTVVEMTIVASVMAAFDRLKNELNRGGTFLFWYTLRYMKESVGYLMLVESVYYMS